MDEKNKEVEIAPVASTEITGVENKGSEAPAESDLQERLKALEAEKAQLQVEKENYRRGLLAAKGKVKEENPFTYEEPAPQVDLEELVDRKVTEKLMASREAQLAQEKDQLLQDALRREAELRRTIQNRPTESAAIGANTEQPVPVKDNFFTAEQLAWIKAKGLDPEVVKKNMGASTPSPI